MFQYNIKLENYPELKKIKKSELKKKLDNIIKLGYNLMYPNTDNMSTSDKIIYNSLEELKSHQPEISSLNKSITQLLGITNNSSKKGELVEGIVEKYIKCKYSESSYTVKRSEAHCGDGWLNLNSGNKAIVEVKAYSKTVGEQEVEKLRYDMKYNQITFGIMVSLGTRIQNSKLIDLEMFSNNDKIYYIVKMGPIFESNDILEIGFDLLEKLSSINSINVGKVILEDNLLLKTNLLLEKISSNQRLKDSYRVMMFDIYQRLDNFNSEMSLLFMEQEYLIKNIVKEIESNSIHKYDILDDSLKCVECYKESKIYLNLLRLIDILERKKVKYEIKKNRIISKIMEVKICNEKLSLSLLDLNVSLSITSKSVDSIKNKKNWELLNSLLI